MVVCLSSLTTLGFAHVDMQHFTRSEHYLERRRERNFNERRLIEIVQFGRHHWEDRGNGDELTAELYYPTEGTWCVVLQNIGGLYWRLITVKWTP